MRCRASSTGRAPAKTSLRSGDFIAEDSLAHADAFVDRLDRKLQLLATQPLMGRARDELARGLRSFPFERYVIFYEPLKDGIMVVRMLHSARDVDAEFGGSATND